MFEKCLMNFRSIEHWFDAARKNEAEHIEQYVNLYNRSRDNRESDLLNIFNHFTALHYACYFNNLTAMQLLID